jgi:hypothetical protein
VETLGGFPHLPAKVRVEKSSPLPTRDADESCARCGLVFALWKPESSPAAVALDSEGETLWRKVEEEWNEAARHDGFVKHCLQHNLLSAAGRLYRARLDKTPGDAIAAKMQAEIVAKASLTMAMAQQRRGPSDPFTRSKWFWTIVLTAMALAIGAAFLWRPKARDVDRPVPAAQYLR